MMAGEVSLAVKDPVTMRVTQVDIVALLDVGEVAPSHPDLAAVVPDTGVQVDTLTGWLCGRQTPLHTRPPGTVVRHWEVINTIVVWLLGSVKKYVILLGSIQVLYKQFFPDFRPQIPLNKHIKH